MIASRGLAVRDQVSAQSKRYGDYDHLLTDRSTPTPPSLTSESSPESYHDQEESAPEQSYGNSPFALHRSSAAPSEDEFFNDWHNLSSPANFPTSLVEMPHSKAAQMNDFSAALDESETKHTQGNSTEQDVVSMDAELPVHPWLPLSVDSETQPKQMYNTVPQVCPSPMPGMLTDRDDVIFNSMIEENHCAPPSAFETPNTSTATSANPLLNGASHVPAPEAAGFTSRMLVDSSVTRSPKQSTSMPSADESDLGVSATRIIRPNRNELPRGMEIHVHGVPAVGAKSRVETQIRMRIELVARAGENKNGEAIWERIGSFGHIKVPPLSGTKRKSKKHQKTNVPLDSMLYLEADVVNATPPHARVYVCNSCRERERKRAHRKKSKKLSPSIHPTEEEMRALNIDPTSPNALELAAERMGDEERKHAVLFNCGDYIDFFDGEAVISTRITCYCRHHREKLGFRIVFTLRNNKGEFIATGSTPPIMIMDDHKSVTQTSASSRATRQVDSNRNLQGDELARSISVSPKGPHVANPTDLLPGRARDRVKPYDERMRFRGGKDLDAGASTDNNMSFLLDSSRNFLWNPMAMPEGAPDGSASNPHVPPTMRDATTASLESVSSSALHDSAQLMTSSVSADLVPPHRAMSLPFDPLLSPQSRTHQAVCDNIPSSEGSPSDMEPRITKLIPTEGPTTGGIEITVLGENFTDGLQCIFGDTPSSQTRVWASTTLVCVLPPRLRPGPVIVSLQHKGPTASVPITNQPLQLFTYIDATDRALMELALQVVGLQMTGQMSSARDIAMRIVHSSQGEGVYTGNEGGSSQRQAMDEAPDVTSLLAYGLKFCRAHNAAPPSVQDSIIGFLSLLDGPWDEEWSQACAPYSAIRACNNRGHTLLHLAVMHNFHRLVIDLLRRGCPVDAQDVNGCTALHFASLHGSLHITRLLLEYGASPYIHDAIGQQPIDVARRAEMIDTEQVLTEHMPDALDEAGWSDATESEPESDADEEEELTPTREMRSVFIGIDTDELSDDTSDASSDAGISFDELAAIQHAANETATLQTSDTSRNSWRFGLLRRFSPKSEEVKKERKTPPPLKYPEQAPHSPPQTRSPPPTYDEATLDDESGTSRHVFGEKLVTGTEHESAHLRERIWSEGVAHPPHKVRRSPSETRQRWRAVRERLREEEVNPVVRTRPSVYDDRMLLWFWIPAMISVFLLTLIINNGSFLHHDTSLTRIFSVST